MFTPKKMQISQNLYYITVLSVPDSRRRIIPEVVLVRARGSWGSGNLEGGGVGWRVEQGRSVYKHPETEVDGSCHS